MILDAYNALRMCSMNSVLFPVNLATFGPGNSLLASTLSSFKEDKQRENTDSPIKVTGIPRSSAEIAVHLPIKLKMRK